MTDTTPSKERCHAKIARSTRVPTAGLLLLSACANNVQTVSPEPPGAQDSAADAGGSLMGDSGALTDVVAATEERVVPLTCVQSIAAEAGISATDDLRFVCSLTDFFNAWRCGDAIIVSVELADSGGCLSDWLFDSKLQHLEAMASDCGSGITCTRGVSGFRFPNECFNSDSPTTILSPAFVCADAGPDS